MTKARITNGSGFGLIVILLMIWESFARLEWLDPNHLPPVSVIGLALFDLLESLEIVHHLLISFKRVMGGYILGSSVGFLLGFGCGYFSRAYSMTELTIEYLRPMPSVALIPIGILFLGMGDALNVAIIGWACSWPVFVNTMDGVRSTDHILVNTARTFGLNKRRIILKVIVPASLPLVFTGLRISLGIAVAVVIITEMVASGSGLGFFIINTSISFRIPQMYAGIIIIGVFGYLMNRAFLLIDHSILKWQRGFLSAGRE
jgi:ABC-type nitrate/sulfonate/bicarbonate transport system permease component